MIIFCIFLSFELIADGAENNKNFEAEYLYNKGIYAKTNGNEEEAFEQLTKAADLGFAKAQYEIALCYFDGYGTEQNKTEALLWYKQAAKQGHEIAQKMVDNWKTYSSIQAKFDSTDWHLELAKRGDVEEQYQVAKKYSDLFKMVYAFNWFRKAADKGFIAAQYEIAERYLFGIGTEKNPQAAFQWFMKITKRKAKTEKETVAIETYLPKTKFMLGKCYEEGIGTAKNPKEAFKFYLETAQSDFEETIAEILKDASYKTALFYFDGTGTNQDRNEAKQWYEKSAEYGHITAKKMLEHWEEYNAIPDKYESLAWHKKLAKQGNAEAQNILGTISEKQYWTSHKKNKKAAKEAFQWYEKSALQGNAEGEYNLAKCYYEGLGIEKNEDHAFSYFTKSAEQNFPEALREVGSCYYIGIGTMKNNTKAVEYYTKAAELGDIKAQIFLDDIDQRGGISEQNSSKILSWDKQASKYEEIDALSKENLGEDTGFHVLWDLIKQGKFEAFPILGNIYMNSEYDYDDEAISAFSNSLKVLKNNKMLMESNEKIAELFFRKSNEKEAFKWFSKAAQQGSAYSQYVVGLHYLCKGNNESNALIWLQKSAKQGYYDAKMMINLIKSTQNITDAEKRKRAKEMVAELKKQGFSDYHAKEWTVKAMMIASLGDIESHALMNKIKDSYLQGTIYTFDESSNSSVSQISKKSVLDRNIQWSNKALELEKVISVNFDSTPTGAVVTVDGRIICQSTPCSEILTQGEHEIKMQKENYLTVERKEKITGSLTTIRHYYLESDSALLTINGNDAVFLKLDGASIGQIPINDKLISTGNHKIELEDSCFYDWSEIFSVKRGEKKNINLNLKLRESAIKVYAQDDKGKEIEAEVFVDNKKVGNTPGTFKVPLCSKKLFVKKGRFEYSEELSLKEKKIKTIQASLKQRDLQWSNKTSSIMSWRDSINYCENLNEGGYSNWRLPNIDELRTLIQNCSGTESGGACRASEKNDCLSSECWTSEDCTSCAGDSSKKYSKLGDTDWYWSSSTFSDNTESAFGVNFDNGIVGKQLRKTHYYKVRCVK